MRAISRRLSLPTTTEETFALLSTPSAIRGWWSAARVVVAPRPRGLWVATWGDDEDAPDYVSAARILAWEPPHRLRLGDFEYYTRTGGLPFDAPLETEFLVADAPNGSTLTVTQSGFPDDAIADDFYAACERGWADTFAGIARFVQATTSR